MASVMLAVSCNMLGGSYNKEEDVLPESLKVLTWNVWNGFMNPLDNTPDDLSYSDETFNYSYGNGTAWVKSQNPDVCIFTEFKYFETVEKQKAFLDKIGHDYFVILKTYGYPIAVSSKRPIKIVEKYIPSVGHGYLVVRTFGVTFIGAHLHPGAVDNRIAEVERIMQNVKKFIDSGESVILMGDFNNRAESDAAFYDARGDVKQDYRPMNMLLADGLLFDLFAESGRDFQGTYYAPSSAEARERIDYILASRDIAGFCSNVFVADTPELCKSSDHLPVVAEFKFNK